jgi:ferritin-like metal-binding protein YciE
MPKDSLRALYVEELKDLYNAERQLVKALPRMARSAKNTRLKQVFTDHLALTKGHVARLERIFSLLDESPRGRRCVGMEGLIAESEELIGRNSDPDVRDAGLIAKAQHVEHYEIAGYGTVRSYAVTLGETEQARLLQQTLNEEERADRLLTGLAESAVNAAAAIGDSVSVRPRRGRADREVVRYVASDVRIPPNRRPTRRKKARATVNQVQAR